MALVVGLCTGTLMADARAPRIRPAPLLSAFLLGTGFILVLIYLNRDQPYFGFIFLFGLILSQAAYAAWLWTKVFPSAGLSYWQFVGREFTLPNRTRQQYAAMINERETSARTDPGIDAPN